MGRLFWKFFTVLWLAQLLTALGVGAAVLWGVPGDLSSIFVGVSADHKPEFVAAKHIPVSLNARPPPHFSGPPPLPHLPILPLVMGSLVSILFAALMAWYMARPIRSLKRALTEIAAGHLSARVGNTMGDRKDELVDLGGQFDHMADRLEHLLESQHRLLHDVSHELRSPLTRLQMATDLLRQQPERSEELIERIQRDTARMDVLVGDLLNLARLERGSEAMRADYLDMGSLLNHIAEENQFLAAGKQCQIEVEMRESMGVQGSHEYIFRAIDNVVRNAVHYSPIGGLVRVKASLDEQLQRVTILISDEGEGVAPSDLNLIFDPFYRAPQGQKAKEGYGLGLAMSRRVIEAHEGVISAHLISGGGFEIAIRLPSCPVSEQTT